MPRRRPGQETVVTNYGFEFFLNQSKLLSVTTLLNPLSFFVHFPIRFFPFPVRFFTFRVSSFPLHLVIFGSSLAQIQNLEVTGQVRFMSFSVYVNFNFFFCKSVCFSRILVCCCRCVWFLFGKDVFYFILFYFDCVFSRKKKVFFFVKKMDMEWGATMDFFC